MKITRKMELPFDYTWTNLKVASNEGRLDEIVKSGDYLPLTLKDGQNIGLDVGKDEKGKIYFIFRDLMKEDHFMNKEWTNAGGWAATEMRRYANEEVFELLPDDLQAVISSTRIVQVLNGERIETEDKLFCLSYTQVFGGDLEKEHEPEDTQIDIYKTEKDRVKETDGETWNWWLRSAGSASSFGGVGSFGNSNGNSAYNTNGVALGFCL